MRFPGNRFLILVFMLLLPALACNMPRGTPTPSEADLIYTAAAETLAVQMTQVSQPPATSAVATPGAPTGVPTFPVPATLPPSAVPTLPLPSPTVTRLPVSPTPVPCDRIKFVKDVTYPDNTEVLPGTKFDKIWRLAKRRLLHMDDSLRAGVRRRGCDGRACGVAAAAQRGAGRERGYFGYADRAE